MRRGQGRVRGGYATLLAVAMTFALSGCRSHKVVRSIVLPPFTPVELAQLPEPSEPPMVEEDEDAEDLPPVPVAEGAATPKRQKRRVKTVASPPAEVPAPAPVAALPTPAESANAIGELTPGGDQDPQTQKEAANLIASNEKRLGALSAEVVRTQAGLVSNVRNFQRQAQQALRTGDAGGAKTLATKGKLLLDDLEKGAGL